MRQAKSIFLTALAALAFAACNKEEVAGTGSPGEVLAGEETYVSFNFKVEGNTTNSRAGMITEKTDEEESAVSNGRILIFDDVSGALLNNEPFTVNGGSNNITLKTTSGSRRIYIITGTDNTAGDKAQIAGKLATLQTTAPASTLADFYALMTDGKYEGTAEGDTDMGDGFKELPVAGKFVMSNVADISAVKTLQPNISKEESGGQGATAENATVNRFEFNVLRAVAKGNLKVEMNKGTVLQTADGVFNLKPEATYGVRNINRGTLYVQQFINDRQTASVNDHSAETGLQPHAAFFDVFEGKGSEDMKKLETYRPYYFKGYPIKGTDAVSITMKANGGGAATAGAAVYFSENSNRQSVRGNTTYFGITTQVASIDKGNIAKSIYLDGSVSLIKSTPAEADYNNTNGDQSFWYIREIPAKIAGMLAPPVRRVFTDAGVAFEAVAIILKNTPIALTTEGFTDGSYMTTALKDAYNEAVNPQGGGTALNADDVAIIETYLGYYENGVSYYRLNLYETTADNNRRHLVRRNHFYNAKVTSFATIGDPAEGDLDKDPEKPVDADATNVTAIIKVADWHNIAMEDDL